MFKGKRLWSWAKEAESDVRLLAHGHVMAPLRPLAILLQNGLRKKSTSLESDRL